LHELTVAMEVVERVVARADGARISRVTMEIGVLTCVLPEALTFCFDLAAAGTDAEGAVLCVDAPPAKVSCRTCGRKFEISRPYGECGCGSVDLEWHTGRELRVVEMEIEDQADAERNDFKEVD